MGMPIHTGLTIAGQTLRALRRYPDRVAFSSEQSSLTYRGTVSLIGQIQAAFSRYGLKSGQRVAILSDNSAESWCAAVAAQGLGLSVTWLHPKASLADHVFQIEDSCSTALVVSVASHAERGGELAARCRNDIKTFALGKSDYAVDLLRLAEEFWRGTCH